MPLYDYVCDTCRAIRELLHSHLYAPKVIPCAECGGEMRKAVSGGQSYTIRGDNSASVTPSRYRKEGPA